MKQHPGIRIFLTAALFFLTLFPSIHSAGHFLHELQEKHCHHKYGTGKAEINHSHHTEDCAACDFIFSPAASVPDIISINNCANGFVNTNNCLKPDSGAASSLTNFLLRGPPSVA